MQCNNCLHKIVCKYFNYAMENLHVGIQINNCNLYNEKVDIPTQQFSPEKQPIIERDLSNGYVDYSSLSNQQSPIEAIPVEIKEVTCDRCKNEVLSIDVDNCSECGRLVCSNCRVDSFNPEKGVIVSICEKCWSGIDDPIPGEEKEVSISFADKENDEWKLEDLATSMDKEIAEFKKEEQDVKSNSKQMDDKRSYPKSKKK